MFPRLLWEKFPFKEVAGLKEDKIADGYIPATAEIKIIKRSINKKLKPVKEKSYGWPIHAEKKGKINFNNRTPTVTATAQIPNVSRKNCRISCVLVAPTTFLTDVSFALLTAPAVVRLT